MDPMIYIWIIIAGALGGAVRSLLGWASKDEYEPFNKIKFLKSVIRAVIGGAIFGYSVISTLPEVPGFLTMVGTFFAAIGTDVIWHDMVKVATFE
ncbi:MAG: hypothetical protein ACTSSP_07490 [Candidatus Asgardarchaeia archaeon]